MDYESVVFRRDADSKDSWDSYEQWFKIASVAPADQEHLLSSMSHLSSGHVPTPAFPLYGRTDISVVEEFLDMIDEKQLGPVWMREYERSRLSKFGPQGGYKPWEELRPLLQYYYERPTQDSTPQWLVSEWLHKYGDLHLKRRSAEETLKHSIISGQIEERAAGCPDFSLYKTDSVAQRHAVQDAKSGQWKNYFGYVFSRYQKLKPRIFMPMPFSLMILQGEWADPFLETVQNNLLNYGADSPYTFWGDKIGFNRMFEIWSDLITENLKKAPGDVILYTQRDFEKMDTTMGPYQLEKGIISLFAQLYDYGYHSQNYKQLREAMLATNLMPIACPDGVRLGASGTASGAKVTNSCETMKNEQFDLLSSYYVDAACKKEGIIYRRLVTGGNGDDGGDCYSVKSSEVERFKEILSQARDDAAAVMGFRTQGSKDLKSLDYGVYCQNMWYYDSQSRSVKWSYPATLIFNAIMNPEHQYTKADWDKDYRDLDVCQKLDNGVGLPYYHELVDYVMDGLKYPLLGRTEAETKRILSKFERYKRLQYAAENFNRRDWHPVNSPTVRYVLEKRRVSMRMPNS